MYKKHVQNGELIYNLVEVGLWSYNSLGIR